MTHSQDQRDNKEGSRRAACRAYWVAEPIPSVKAMAGFPGVGSTAGEVPVHTNPAFGLICSCKESHAVAER